MQHLPQINNLLLVSCPPTIAAVCSPPHAACLTGPATGTRQGLGLWHHVTWEFKLQMIKQAHLLLVVPFPSWPSLL